VGDEAKWYQLDGSELLRPWISNWGYGIRDSSRLVQKSKKQYTCVLGCPIKPGEKYARFELQGAESAPLTSASFRGEMKPNGSTSLMLNSSFEV
jgi:hypothetical protein